MEWEEISRRLRNGTSVSVLAELAGTTYKNMYNRIRRREQLDGKQYLKPEQLKRPYKAQGGRKKAASGPEAEPIGEEKAPARPEVVEKVADVPEVVLNIPEALLPETVKEIAFQITYYEKLAERYRKQAEDYKRILQAFM